MHGDTHDTRTRQARKVGVLELLRHDPRDEITGVARSARQALEDDLTADITFQRDLQHTERLRQTRALLEGRQQHKDSMSGSITQ